MTDLDLHSEGNTTKMVKHGSLPKYKCEQYFLNVGTYITAHYATIHKFGRNCYGFFLQDYHS